jgi:O-methyltransferase
MPKTSQLRRRLKGMFKAKGHIDAIAGTRILGWSFADGASVRVEASVGGKVIAAVVPTLPRHDIAHAFPGWERALVSGFALDLPPEVLPSNDVIDVTIIARAMSSIHLSRKLAQISVAGSETIARLTNPSSTGTVGPFPKDVIDTVFAVWPETERDLTSAAAQADFVDRLRTILRTQALRSAPAITDYVRYLQAVWAHFRFVDAFFPTVNPTAVKNSPDFNCKPNSIYEIIAIAHQLYVLKSYGITGDFAEFGCFKGFSSAMLSFACRQLDLKMHIFDSFEGLPPADGSGYRAGEYAGTLDEVRTNVTRYGAIEVVEFHPGFFNDTFRNYRPPELMCLWMDVDLESSSRDLMVVADRLDPRATVFSHESESGMFVDGEVVNAPRLDNPIPPMLDRFTALGRPLVGRFVRGSTGAFWPREGGVPALDNHVLIDLVTAASDPDQRSPG